MSRSPIFGPCQVWRPNLLAHSRCPRLFRLNAIAFLSLLGFDDESGDKRHSESNPSRLPYELAELILQQLAVTFERNYSARQPFRVTVLPSSPKKASFARPFAGKHCVAVKPNGDLLISDGTRVHTVSPDGRPTGSEQREVTAMAVSATGDVAFSNGQVINVRRAGSGASVELKTPDRVIIDSSSDDETFTVAGTQTALAWAMDGRLLALDAAGQELHIFAPDLALERSIPIGYASFLCAAESGFLAAGVFGVTHHSLSNGGKRRLTVPVPHIAALAVDVAGNVIVSRNDSTQARVWVLEAGTDRVLWDCAITVAKTVEALAVLETGEIVVVGGGKVVML